MMNQTQRTIRVGLIAALLIVCMITGAVAEGISPRYSMISSIHGACYIENGTLDLSGTVTARAKTDYAKVTLTLQAHIGGKWKNQGSWSATGTITATKMKELPAERDVLYRLKITGYVSNSESGEKESTTIYSDVVSY